MNLIDFRESALMAFDTVRANKLRSVLTILGVTWCHYRHLLVGIIQG
jgi:hypothetical protein